MLSISGSFRRRPRGKFPSVSINDDKVVVEAYQASGVSRKIHYKVGKLKGQKMNMCEDDHLLDKGRYPKVAINNENIVVEVHEGKVWNNVHYRIGKVNLNSRRIIWNNNVQQLCWGRYPAVAVHKNRVVITHDYPYMFYTTYYHIGTMNRERNAIDWTVTRERLFESFYVSETSVAVNDRCMVVTGRGGVGEILCRIGHIQGDRIAGWRDISFEYLGYCATVGLKDDGHILMVWQSFALRRLIYITGKLDHGDRPRNIEWSSSESCLYGVGYNPTVSVSPEKGLVLEEHETNYGGLRRCTLYYHCGTLVEDDEEQEDPDPIPNPNGANLLPAARQCVPRNQKPHRDQNPYPSLQPNLYQYQQNLGYRELGLRRQPQHPQRPHSKASSQGLNSNRMTDFNNLKHQPAKLERGTILNPREDTPLLYYHDNVIRYINPS